MNPALKILLFVVSLIALLVFQAKGVMPLVYKVVASDFFLEDSDDQASQIAVSNDMTNFAFNHCNTYIVDDIDSDFSTTPLEKPINVWTIGNYEYVVNAEIEITPKDGASFTRRYVCRIKYTEKDDLSLADNFDNWSIKGLSGLDNL